MIASNKNTQNLSGLGLLDYSSVGEAVANLSGSKINFYQKWTEKQRFQIGKYAAENGPAAVARKLTTKQNPLNESTVRRFCKMELEQASKEKRKIKSTLKCLPRGRPYLLGSLDEMIKRYLLAPGGLVLSAIAIATAKALNVSYPEYNLGYIDIDSSSWAKSLFKRMGFAK